MRCGHRREHETEIRMKRWANFRQEDRGRNRFLFSSYYSTVSSKGKERERERKRNSGAGGSKKVTCQLGQRICMITRLETGRAEGFCASLLPVLLFRSGGDSGPWIHPDPVPRTSSRNRRRFDSPVKEPRFFFSSDRQTDRRRNAEAVLAMNSSWEGRCLPRDSVPCTRKGSEGKSSSSWSARITYNPERERGNGGAADREKRRERDPPTHETPPLLNYSCVQGAIRENVFCVREIRGTFRHVSPPRSRRLAGCTAWVDADPRQSTWCLLIFPFPHATKEKTPFLFLSLGTGQDQPNGTCSLEPYRITQAWTAQQQKRFKVGDNDTCRLEPYSITRAFVQLHLSNFSLLSLFFPFGPVACLYLTTCAWDEHETCWNEYHLPG
jgi:hypothetical protein